MRQGRGATGTNIDYVQNTVAHLVELGLRDRTLEELARRAVGQRRAAPSVKIARAMKRHSSRA